MTVEDYVEVASFGVQTAIMVSGPVLIAGLVAGVAVSIFQAASQINDSALAFIPKILATVVTLYILGPWMMAQLSAYANYTFGRIPTITM